MNLQLYFEAGDGGLMYKSEKQTTLLIIESFTLWNVNIESRIPNKTYSGSQSQCDMNFVSYNLDVLHSRLGARNETVTCTVFKNQIPFIFYSRPALKLYQSATDTCGIYRNDLQGGDVFL